MSRTSTVNKRAIDLLDDAPWPSKVPLPKPAVDSSQPWLVASLVFVILLISSMALPSFTSDETPPWTPLSRWLNLGWSPGTQHWGLLVVILAAATAIGIGLVIPSPRRALMPLLLLFITGLGAVTLVWAYSRLSVNPGPNLHAGYGGMDRHCCGRPGLDRGRRGHPPRITSTAR